MSRSNDLQTFLARIPLAQTLGMQCEIHGDEMTTVLPFQKKLIGNFQIQALHGGAISAFLELTATLQIYLRTDLTRPPRPINVTVDYLRQGHAQDLYARAHITKMGRRIASVRAECWQDHKDKPVTALMAHFLVAGD